MRSASPRWTRDVRVTVLVLLGVFVAVAAVYLLVVLGGGLLIGHTESPHVGLSVVATAVVALGFEPVRARLEEAVSGWLSGGQQAPYDVLSRFSESLAGDVDGSDRADLPARMARLLVEGTGARWVQVWIMVGDRPELEAAWPVGADASAPGIGGDAPGLRTLDVLLTDERLGMLRLQEHDGAPLSPVEERLFEGLAAQAGLALRGAQLRVELSRRADELGALAHELQASRLRVVDAHDVERRRLERDIHDGAQQHLVALVVNLRLAQTLTERAPDRAAAVLAQQADAVGSAITTLVELSRGIYPQVLVDEGVAAAIGSLVSTSGTPVAVLDRGVGRHPEGIEAALYFCGIEAIQNAVKHASASRIEVELDRAGDRVTLLVRDDGIGFDHASGAGLGGLANMRDRVDSVGGELSIRVNDVGGTDVLASVPVSVEAGVS